MIVIDPGQKHGVLGRVSKTRPGRRSGPKEKVEIPIQTRVKDGEKTPASRTRRVEVGVKSAVALPEIDFGATVEAGAKQDLSLARIFA